MEPAGTEDVGPLAVETEPTAPAYGFVESQLLVGVFKGATPIALKRHILYLIALKLNNIVGTKIYK